MTVSVMVTGPPRLPAWGDPPPEEGGLPWVDLGGGLRRADPALYTGGGFGALPPFVGGILLLTITEETTIRFSVSLSSGPLRLLPFNDDGPMGGGEDSAFGVIFMVQAQDQDENGIQPFAQGGWRDWAAGAITLPQAGTWRVGFAAGDVPVSEMMPGLMQDWPSPPAGVTATNQCWLRGIEIDPLPAGPPVFGFAGRPVGPVRASVPRTTVSMGARSPVFFSGIVRTPVPDRFFFGNRTPAPSVHAVLGAVRNREAVRSWRNLYPPAVAEPCQDMGAAFAYDRVWKIAPGVTKDAVMELVFACGGVGVLHFFAWLVPTEFYGEVTYREAVVAEVVEGIPVERFRWEPGTAPVDGSAFSVPVDGAGEKRFRVTMRASNPSGMIFPSALYLADPVLTWIGDTGPADMAVAVKNPSYAWSLPALDAATAQEIYTCTLTGSGDGLPDIELPLSSFGCRLRQGDPSYLTITVPVFAGLGEEIAARSHGTLIVKKGYRLVSGVLRTEEIVRGELERTSAAGGGRSGAVTLVGYHRYSGGGGARRVLSGVTYEGHQMDGRRMIRAAVDMWIRPGDIVFWSGGEMVVGVVSLTVSPRSASMQLTEVS